MPEIQKVIGLMSGTSLDGIDAALLETDGLDIVRPGEALAIGYDEDTRDLLRSALAAAATTRSNADSSWVVRDAEERLTYLHAVAVKALLDQAGLKPADITLLGFHGQTILHRPAQHRTWQIGDGTRLARMTGIDVVDDFRSADVAAGGQGAPFVPLYHAALVRSAGIEGPVAVANIGGVANVTYVDKDLVLAFDTGPGNAPIDDWILQHTGQPYDRDGGLARQGSVDKGILARMLAHPYFEVRPPKSLDRQDFGFDLVGELSPQDGAATLTAFTAATLAMAARHFPQIARRWIVCGGGRHNPALMDELKARISGEVVRADELGWRGDFIEAEAFAYLAVRSVTGLPLSLPTTTGVKAPISGGHLHKK